MASNIRSASLPPGFELEENERDSFSALGPDLPEGFTLDVDQGDLLPGFELEQPAAPQPKLFPLTGGKTALGRQLYTTEAGELIGDRVVAITAPGLNGGKPTLVPLIHNGHILPEQEAIQRVIAAGGKDPETGKPLPFYETPDEALSAMEKLNSAKPAPVTAVQIPDAVGGEGGVARPQSLQIPAGPLSALPAQPLPDPMAQQEVATDPDQATWRDFIADITEAAKGLPGALKSAAASAWEGNNPEEIAKAKDWADRVINERRARSDANFTMEGADDVYVDLGPVRITRADVRNLPENVAFSLVSLLGGLVAGGAGAFIGGPVGGIAGMAGGSGVAAYRMDTNQVLRQLRDGLDRAALRDIGRPLTDDEWLSIAQSEDMQAAAYRLGVLWSRTANPAEEVRKHGLHEAGWEAVGNAALFAAGKALYQLGKSRNLLGAKAAGAFVGGSAMEVLTEAETHIGQAGVETRLGLREGREPEYLNLHDQYEAIREVAGPTLMLTGVMGAGAAGAGAAVRTVQDLNQARILRRELDQANLGDPEAIARDALTPKPIRGWDAQGRPVMEEVQSPAYTAEVQPTPWGDELPEGFHLVDPNQVAQVSADASDSPGAPPPPASSTQTGVSAESTAAAQPEPISNAALQADRQTIAELERLAAQASDPAVRQRLLRDAKILRDELEGENKVKLTPWERARRARHPSSNDDLITAIRKLGGIDTKRETDWEGRLSHLNKQNRAFGLPGIERPGSGLTLDEIAERLVELGFLENKDAHELEEKLWQAETGVKIYSRIVEGEIWERELQEALAARGEDVEPIDEVDEWDDILSAAWEDLQTSAAGMSSAQAGPRPPEEDGAFSDAFDVLRRVAAEIDEDAAENILERAAIADWGEQETARELLNVIRGSATSGTQDSQAAPGGDAGAEGPWRDAEGQPAGEGGGLPGIDQGDQGAPQSQGVVPLGGVERRADLTRRKRVSEMTPEEKDRELLTSRRTGLWNDRAYEEHDRLPIQVSIDLDGLKWLNDNLGHEAGDQLLRAMGDAMRAVTDRAYHISGDEFILQANTEEEARATVERINEIAARATITVELPDGSRITKKGVGFSYGIGQDLATAEAGLQQHKAERERAGLRSARGGEPAGVVRTPPAGEQDRGREAADVPATDEEEVARGPAVSIADRLKVRPERITSPTHRDLLSDAQDRDIVTKDDVRALFDAGEGVFGSGLHIPTEQQIAEQINALKVARMGKAAEQKAISKYEKEVSDLIDEAIELSAIGRTLSRVGVRKDAQAPAGVTTAGQKYNVAAAEYSNIVAAKLREAAKTAAFLEALKRRNPPAKQKAAPQSPAEQRPSGGDVLSQLSTISLDELEAMIDDVAGSADVPDTAKPARSRSKSGTSRSGTRAPRKTRSKPETTDTSNPAEVERTAGEIAKSLGYNLSSAGMEALKGLTELFGGPGKLNSGLTFNEETYAKAKPHFEAMLRDAIAAGKDLRDLIRAILNAFGTGVKPYIMRFAQDVQAGAVDLGNAAAQNQGTGRTETTTDESDQRGDANLERDRGDAGTGDRVGQEGVSAGHAGGRGGVRPGAQGTDGRGGRSGSGDRVPGRVPAAGGTQGDSPLSADQTGPEGGAAGSDDGERGGDVGLDGSPVESVATEAVAKAATKPLDLAEKIRLQKEADTKYRIIPADPQNIEDTLPALTEGQRGDVLFAERRFSTPDGYGVLFTNGTGTGKAQPLDAKILTPRGWVRMGDIKVGDDVISVDGTPTKVLGVYPQGKKGIYRVTFDDGSFTECCDEHLWLTQTLQERRKASTNPEWNCAKPKVRQLSEIRATLDKQHFIPVVAPVQLQGDISGNLLPAYTMGVILGDGGLTGGSLTFSTPDDHVAQRVEAELPASIVLVKQESKNRCVSYRLTNAELGTEADGTFSKGVIGAELERLGLLGLDSFGKFIPREYLYAKVEDRIALLQGLMDTDGTADERTNSAYFTTVSPSLKDGFVELVQSLGGIARVNEKVPTYTYRGERRTGQKAYTVTVALPEGIAPFSLDRKARKLRARTWGQVRRKIVSVEYVGEKAAQCIAVEHEAHLYVTDSYIVTHNTFTGLGIVKRFAQQGKTNTIIVVPSDKIAADWIESGRILGLDIKMLESTRDAGNGVVITTYANLGQNNTLIGRMWDLIVADESHYLMSGKDRAETNALRTLRAISMHSRLGGSRRGYAATEKEREELERVRKQISANIKIINRDDTMWDIANALRQENEKLEARAEELQSIIDARYRAEQALVEQYQGEKRPRVVFLSATPFSYEKTVDYAEEYLFTYEADQGGRGYNSGSPFDRFMMQHFGYRMRNNKLTAPGPEVDRGLLQRQFNAWLKKNSVLSSRLIDVPFDYDRKFVLVESDIGAKIDAALDDLRNDRRLRPLAPHILEKFDHLGRRYLLEAIKAREVIPMIREHLALGRKVVVFHDFKKGGGFNPFDVRYLTKSTEEVTLYSETGEATKTKIADIARLFIDAHRELVEWPLASLPSPIETFKREFGEDELVIFNGDIPKSERREAVRKFQDDNSKVKIILVQSAAGREGISLHDTTGKHQRVLFNLGLPTTPATAIQQEGRIYRIGQQSDAIFRYLNTGTNWERLAFADTIARRASAVENLAQGEEARALMDAFIQGFEESDRYPAGAEGEGKGGKERDRAAMAALSEWDRAKTLYFSQQKKTSRNKAAEGIDYFATPEPVGLKMVELADIRGGEDVLEPSAGHGAIARWFPENARRTVIEPSTELYSRLRIATDAKALQERFEDHNIVNKYDAIVMNPPFGHGGKTAIEHLAKAAKHLRDRGRIVALIPTGPAADKRFDDWMYGTDAKGKKADPSSDGMYLVADIKLPPVTFERAGTRVSTRIVVLEKVMDREEAAKLGPEATRDYSDIQTIGELFDRLEGLELKPRRRLSQQPGSETLTTGPQAGGGARAATEAGGIPFTLAQTRHAKKGIDLYVATFSARVPREVYDRVNSIAKKHGGYYSSYNKQGAIPGFQFESEADRAAFLAEVNGESVQEERAGYGVDLPQTIDVDGVQRPTSNSEGQPIAATEEAVRNFWRWFRDSKVVDDEGRPLVVYHGSEQEFDEFKPGDRFGYYFTENKAVANQYGEVREYYLASQKHLDLTTEEGLKVVDEIASRFDPEDIVDSQGDQVSLREIVEYGDWSGGGALQDRFLREVQKRGYTGVTMEDFHGGGQNETAIVVFDPRQIKSATGNRGTFDPADPRTLLQRSRITQATYEDRIDELFRDENPRRIGAVSRSSTVSAEAVESVREAVRAQLRGIDGVAWDVVPTEADLPEGLRKAIEQEGAAGQVTAAYHEGAIYYVAERLSDPLAVEVATLHELDGHVGFERIFGSEATKAGNDLYMRMGGMDGIRRLADQYGIDFAPYIETAKGIDDLSRRRAYLVNELLAHLQEVRAVESLPARIKRALQTYWGAIRQWLREHGFTVVGTEFTDSDLAYLLRSMSRAARGQGKTIIYREPTEAWFQRKRQPPLVQLSLPNTATIQPMDILRPIGQPAASRKVAGTDLGPFLDRLNSEADAKELFARTVKQFEDRFTDARRGKVSWKETEEMARSLGWTGDKLMERRRGQAFNAEEWEAARTIVDKAMSEVLEAAQRAANGGTDQDLVLFRQRLSKFVPLAEQVMGARAEWGRLGSIMRKQASQAKAVAEILDAMGGRMTIEMQAKAIADVAASGASPETVRKTMVKVAKVRFIDKIIEIWINGLLSGPQTHAVNIASNQLIALLSIPEHAVAALVGKLHGGGDKVYMREILPRAWGLLSGARDGALLGAQVFSSTAKRYHLAKTQAMREGLTGAALKARTRELVEKARKLSGDRPENLSAEEAIVWDIHEQSQTLEEGTDFFEKVDTGYRKAIGGVSGRFIRTPGNFLQSQDEFYKAIAFRMDLNARAMRQAIREGLKGPELYERASEIARKVDALRGLDRPAMLATPEEEMLWNMRDELMHFARYQTFTNPLGPLGRTMQAIATRWPVFRFIVPFIRTPVNIVKFAGHRSPVAPLMRSFREEWAKGGAARDVAVARMVVGTGIGMAVMMLAMQGIITGGGPTDPNKRRVWLQKYRPYSIKIGDTWYSYGRLEPLGMIMGVSADLASVFHVMDEADAEEVAGLLYASVVKNLASKTFLQGISNAVAAYYDPDRYGEAWLTQFAGTAIPTGIAQVARVQDPTLRRAETIIEKWKSRIPGLSDDLLPRRDIFGQPIVLGGGWGPDIISPVYIGLDPHDPVVDEMIRLGVTVSPPRKQIGRVELTPEQYDQYAELSGTLAKKMLDQFVAQPSYNQIPDAMRQEMIEKFFNAAREQARVMLFTQYPEIIRQQTQKKVEEMREGLGQ